MKCRVGLVREKAYNTNTYILTPIFYNDEKEWAFSNYQSERYETLKGSESVDLRDKVKWIRMEEVFHKQYSGFIPRILIHYEP